MKATLQTAAKANIFVSRGSFPTRFDGSPKKTFGPPPPPPNGMVFFFFFFFSIPAHV